MNVILLKRACALCSLFFSTLTIAQDQAMVVEDLLVIAHPLSGESLAQAVEVLEGKELERKLAANIGATLARQPGIHSAPFGNAVGRPIIHGLSGPRVKIMEDRIDTLDVSVTSGDHAVGVEPFIAERIEVLKGASSLLYGTGAIGGVVDIHTGRIPHAVPNHGLSGGIETRFNDNTSGNTTAVKLNGGLGEFAWHIDGTRKDGDDYKIPGFAESARIRALEPASEEHARSVLPGSYFASTSAAVGVSYLASWGLAGLSVSTLDSNYGLPGGHEEEGEGGVPMLQLEQIRTDVELAIKNPFGNFTSLNIRVGINDYEHQEIEPNGEIATNFLNKAWESRAELSYEATLWTSVFGVQQSSRKFSALGEEAFIPPVNTNDVGVFWVAERSFNVFDVETGLRFGRLKHQPDGLEDQSFSTYAASLGAVFPIYSTWELGVIADYASRAPVAEELYSNGPHLVTQTYELGNAGLNNEKALNLSATLQYTGGLVFGSVTGYHIQFSDFIFQQMSGAKKEELAVVAYHQNNAKFVGLDAELGVNIFSQKGKAIRLKGLFDSTHASVNVTGNNHLPRIPPMRFGIAIEADWGDFNGAIDYVRVSKQNNVANLEWATAAYNDLAIHLEYEQKISKRTSVDIFLQGKNLTNEEQRIHTSFIKEFAPAPGRAIEVGIRVVF